MTKEMTIDEALDAILALAMVYVESEDFTEESSTIIMNAINKIVDELEKQPRSCKTCKYYTGKTGGRMSKTKRYCNRTATINMQPDDFCSRWDEREEMQNDSKRVNG